MSLGTETTPLCGAERGDQVDAACPVVMWRDGGGLLSRHSLASQTELASSQSEDEDNMASLSFAALWRITTLFGPEIWVKCKLIQTIADNNYYWTYV